MKKKLHQLISPELSEKETDELMGALVTQQMNAELRQRLAHTLKEEHGIRREMEQKKGKIKYLNYMLAIAASITVLIALVFYPNGVDDSPQVLAQQYLSEQPLSHPGTFKGATVVDEQRTQAIVAFNQGDFTKAIEHFEALTAPTAEDTYYLGLAHLKKGDYSRAITLLTENKTEGKRFVQEARWFLGLAYLTQNNTKNAVKELKAINKDEWKYDEAQSLLEEIKDSL
ncbi:tetratricopeptide repeat protein [uncultured Croceitalea sp.]|uniref:tetratricopeptide repeat protein n=1 Tax=uncultured Croceitalea sp. TaxID=1798908 RepID=UPI00330627C4